MIGKRLGNWVIEKEVGRGGMGAVYLGRRAPETQDSAVAELAAIKVLGPELASDSGFLHRFQREVDALRLLDHPHIVRFYESGVEEGRYFYAMEYVAGRNFDELLQERGRLPWKEVLDMALQVCPALKHAHDHGIIHRDLKPQNLMRNEAGLVKLADFGVAKVFASRQLTATGGIVGTAEYISPEQASGKQVTARSDLYSFGVVLYTLLTGRLPFAGDTILDLIHAHRYARFDAPSKYVTDLPHEFDELVCGLMAKDPSDRPANALMLLRSVESIHRKMQRRESFTVVAAHVDATKAENQQTTAPPADEAGPATLMSRLMRRELEAERRGSRLSQFFNHPAVLVLLFLLCVGAIGWRFWPASAASLFARGERLMLSDDPLDWERAEQEAFTPLDRKYPEHPYGEAVKDYRERIEVSRAERGTRRTISSPAASEAERFYQRGVRQRAEGNVGAAEQTFRNLVTVFEGIPAEEKWVRMARRALADVEEKSPPAERFKSVHAALERTRTMKREEAVRIWDALENLYGDDPSAEEIRKQIAALRAQR